MLKRLCQLIRQFLLKPNPSNLLQQNCQIFQLKLLPHNPHIRLWDAPSVVLTDGLKANVLIIYQGLDNRPITLYANYSPNYLRLHTRLKIESSLFQLTPPKNKLISGLNPGQYKSIRIGIKRPLSAKNSPTLKIPILQRKNTSAYISTHLPKHAIPIAPPQSAYTLKFTASTLYRLPTETRRKLRQALAQKTAHPENDIQLLTVFQNLPQPYEADTRLPEEDNTITLTLGPPEKAVKQTRWTYVVGRAIKDASQILDANLDENALR